MLSQVADFKKENKAIYNGARIANQIWPITD